jgi:hypothetical protein
MCGGSSVKPVSPSRREQGPVFTELSNAGWLRAAVHQHSETFHVHVGPFLGLHLGA